MVMMEKQPSNNGHLPDEDGSFDDSHCPHVPHSIPLPCFGQRHDEVALGMQLLQSSYALPSLLCHLDSGPVSWSTLNLNSPDDGQNTQMRRNGDLPAKTLRVTNSLHFSTIIFRQQSRRLAKFSYDLLPGPVDLDYNANLIYTPVDGALCFAIVWSLVLMVYFLLLPANVFTTLWTKMLLMGMAWGYFKICHYCSIQDNKTTLLSLLQNTSCLGSPNSSLGHHEDILKALERYHTDYTHYCLDLLHFYPEHSMLHNIASPTSICLWSRHSHSAPSHYGNHQIIHA